MHRNNPLEKGFALVIIALFIGVSIIPSTGSNVVVENVNDENRIPTIDFYILSVLTQGCGYVSPPGGVYPAGTVVCIMAIPCSNWAFHGWSGDISGTENPTCLTMDGDKIIIAQFHYTLPIEINGCGNVTKDPDYDGYPVGTTVQLTAEPCPGWSFAYWSGDISGTENPTYININANMVTGVTANFEFTNPPEISDVTLIHSIPKDIEPGFGWENISCTVTDNGTLDVVQINFTYTRTYFPPPWMWGVSTEWEEYFNFPMNNIGNTYYYNTTLTDAGRYSYHIWAMDSNGNQNSTLPEWFFLPLNTDVNEDGYVGFVDILSAAGMWGATGTPGWNRADADNDGFIVFLDIMYIAGHYRLGPLSLPPN